MSTVYYTADISHLNNEEYWKHWHRSLPVSIQTKLHAGMRGLTREPYLYLAFTGGRFVGVYSTDELLEDDDGDGDQEYMLSWEDFNEAIMGG